MAMNIKEYRCGNLALVLIGEESIPVIGPLFNNKHAALQAANSYLNIFYRYGLAAQHARCSVIINRQADGRYSLTIKRGPVEVEMLSNLDELLLKRFCRGLQRGLFVISSFWEDELGRLDCLALTEGLGAVLVAVH